MSHFTVLVIGDNAEKQLAPFNEQDEKFGVFEDEEDSYLEEYKTKSSECVQMGDGTYFSMYDKELKHCWFRKNEWGSSSEAKFTPPNGSQVLEVPYSTRFATFELFMSEYHNMTRDLKHNRYGSNSNPNAKWDWYSLGGRWTGFFKLKSRANNGKRLDDAQIAFLSHEYGCTKLQVETLAMLVQKGDFNEIHDYNQKNPIKGGYYLEKALGKLLTYEYDNAKVGDPGLGTKLPEAGMVDSARIGDIDFEGMVRDAGIEAGKRFEKVEGLLGGSIPKLTFKWSDLIDPKNAEFAAMSIDKKRDMYHAQPAKKLIEEAKKKMFLSKEDSSLLTWLDLEDYQCTKEEYVRRFEGSALSTFAVLKDGKWYEKGEMGWWGMTRNEMAEDQWNEEFMKLIKGLPGDTLLSVYDCHI